MDWCCSCGDCARRDPYVQSNVKATPAIPLYVIMKGMALGTVMYKIRGPDRWYRRKYKVDLQNMRLSYTPSSKPLISGRVSSVDLYELEEVRKGWNSDIFNRLEAKFRRKLQATFHPQLRSMLKEDNCFSLVLGPSHSVVDLVAPNVHTRDAWVRGLNQLIASCKSTQNDFEHDRWLKEQVRKADVNGNGSLNFEECLTLLKQLNISMGKKDARALFDASNFRKVKIDGEDALDTEEFVHFYHSLTQRPEIDDLMKKYSVSRSTIWGAEELQIFLQKEQNVIASISECGTMIDKFEPVKDKIEDYMSIRGFKEMLLSVDHNIFNKRHHIIYQDMTQPLNHYYIASSHNTYLIHGQLIGESSIEGYIKALMAGCRCLELDTWDGSDGEPVIFHGYTLTSRILFKDVIDAIQQYAFHASQYPVILSLENHCSIPQQIKMAHYLTTILGDYLYKDDVDAKEAKFPSPETLARKILIKAKKLKEEESSVEFILEDEEEREIAYAAAMAAAAPNPSDEAPNPSDDDSIEAPLAAPANSKMIAKELSDLVNYCSARRFSSFKDCSYSWRFHEMASFQESLGLNLGTTEGEDFVAYNKRHLSRIYPKGTRTDSSNYDATPYWNLGCQLVAINYQTWDQPRFIYESKFAQNGRCGYILKPKYLCNEDDAYDPNYTPHYGYEHYVKIKVISGQCLPKPGKSFEGEVVDPYVSITVSGNALDKQKKKTKHIHNNGFNPVWNEKFLLVFHAPEVAMITFRVKDQNTLGKNELLGQFSLPYTSLTEGYRHIHLQDAKGQSLFPATIFVHLVKEGRQLIPLMRC